MDCADYCVDCDGDSDGNGNDLLYGVLDKEKRSGVYFQDAFVGRKQKGTPNGVPNNLLTFYLYYDAPHGGLILKNKSMYISRWT